jgi:hypothetical protein
MTDRLFEDAFDPNNKFHAKWLKDFVNGKDGTFEHNPFGITVTKCDRVYYTDIVLKLSRKFVNSSVCYKFGTLFSYDYAWHMDGEYQNCKLLTAVHGVPKGTRFEYALVYPDKIDFYDVPDETRPSLTIPRW